MMPRSPAEGLGHRLRNLGLGRDEVGALLLLGGDGSGAALLRLGAGHPEVGLGLVLFCSFAPMFSPTSTSGASIDRIRTPCR